MTFSFLPSLDHLPPRSRLRLLDHHRFLRLHSPKRLLVKRINWILNRCQARTFHQHMLRASRRQVVYLDICIYHVCVLFYQDHIDMFPLICHSHLIIFCYFVFVDVGVIIISHFLYWSEVGICWLLVYLLSLGAFLLNGFFLLFHLELVDFQLLYQIWWLTFVHCFWFLNPVSCWNIRLLRPRLWFWRHWLWLLSLSILRRGLFLLIRHLRHLPLLFYVSLLFFPHLLYMLDLLADYNILQGHIFIQNKFLHIPILTTNFLCFWCYCFLLIILGFQSLNW